MPLNTVLPSATTVIGRLKSKTSGDSSSVKAATPRVVARTVLPSRTRSTRPAARGAAKSGVTFGISVG